MKDSVYKKIADEANQSHELRIPLLKKISDHFYGRHVLSFYTSFESNRGVITDQDSDMLKDILWSLPQDEKKLLLIWRPQMLKKKGLLMIYHFL